MSTGLQARIIAILFAAGALGLFAIICDDWWSEDAVQFSRTLPTGDVERSLAPVRGFRSAP